MIAQSVRAVSGLRDVLDKHGISLVVSFAASKGDVYREELPTSVRVSTEFAERNEQIRKALAAAGVVAPDTRSALVAGKIAQQLYMRTDSHWTGYGAEIAAAQTAAAIAGAPSQGGPNVPASAAPGVAVPLGWFELDVDGDLVKFLPSSQQSKYPREPLQVRQFKASDALLAPPPSQVAVVGNSYANPVFGFAQTVSAKLQRPVDLYWKFGSIGPWRCLAQYLERLKPENRSQLKTVVWQFSDYMMGSGPDAQGAWGKDNVYASADEWLSAVKRGLA